MIVLRVVRDYADTPDSKPNPLDIQKRRTIAWSYANLTCAHSPIESCAMKYGRLTPRARHLHQPMNLKALVRQIRRLVSRLPIPGSTVGVAVGHEALSKFVANLDWANADPTKYLYAGTRGISRGTEEAHRVWQTIPESLRATGPDAVAKHLEGLDWSHIVPFSAGGSNDASNGIFERLGLNRARGARTMDRYEIRAARRILQGKAFSAALSATASRMFAGAMVAAATACVLAILEHGLEWQRGRIDRDEMLRLIARETGRSAGFSPQARRCRD